MEVGVQVPAAVLEAEQERVVVEPGRVGDDLVPLQVEIAGQPVDRPEDRVAQADDLDRGRLRDRPDEDRQRVRVVQQPGIGTHLGHVPGDAEDDRNGAQGAEDATDADRVGDRVPEAEPGRDVEVDLGRAGSTDLDRVDDEVGTTERRAPVKMGRDRRLGVERRGGPVSHPLSGRETIGVDVVEGDVRGPQGRAREDVAEEVLRELDAAGADEDDPGHARSAHLALVRRRHPDVRTSYPRP